MRHKDKKINIFDLIEKNYFEFYQSTQNRKSFDKVKFMIVFIGLESTKALFYNIYRINGTKELKPNDFPEGFLDMCP